MKFAHILFLILFLVSFRDGTEKKIDKDNCAQVGLGNGVVEYRFYNDSIFGDKNMVKIPYDVVKCIEER